jgi:hypothetical protein
MVPRRDICEARGIMPTQERTVTEGWYDKPKGLSSFVGERVDSILRSFLLLQKTDRDEEGHRDTTYSLEVPMESLDTLQEKTCCRNWERPLEL